MFVGGVMRCRGGLGVVLAVTAWGVGGCAGPRATEEAAGVHDPVLDAEVGFNPLNGARVARVPAPIGVAYEEGHAAMQDLGFLPMHRTHDALWGTIKGVTARHQEVWIRLDLVEGDEGASPPVTRVAVGSGPLGQKVARALMDRLLERIALRLWEPGLLPLPAAEEPDAAWVRE